ncbi:MAG: PilZ domain-containing protein [Phycisphaerales bacterium]|nr:PilZ domain-containing protein [Phycisphaerales bacterium]
MLCITNLQNTDRPYLNYVPAPLPFERRGTDRQSIDATAQAVHFDAMGGYHLLRLDMHDVSDGGLGVISDRPVAPGTRLHVRVLPRSPMYGATVVRCRPNGAGYDLGIRIARTMAA